MGSYQRQRSRSTAGIVLDIRREWKTYKKERAGKRLEREREREMGKKVSVDDRSKYLNGLFKYSSSIITILSMLKSKFPPNNPTMQHGKQGVTSWGLRLILYLKYKE